MVNYKNSMKDTTKKALLYTIGFMLVVVLMSYVSAIPSGNINKNCIKVYNYAPCYQESANVSNQTGIDGNCALNYTGSYANDDTLNGWGNINNLFDGDYNTYSESPIDTAGLFINYTKPANVSSVGNIWQVKNFGGITNVTIPASCFDYYSTYVSFRILSQDNTPPNNWFCYNGSWINIYNTDVSTRIYEEGIYWNITSQEVASSCIARHKHKIKKLIVNFINNREDNLQIKLPVIRLN